MRRDPTLAWLGVLASWPALPRGNHRPCVFGCSALPRVLLLLACRSTAADAARAGLREVARGPGSPRSTRRRGPASPPPSPRRLRGPALRAGFGESGSAASGAHFFSATRAPVPRARRPACGRVAAKNAPACGGTQVFAPPRASPTAPPRPFPVGCYALTMPRGGGSPKSATAFGGSTSCDVATISNPPLPPRGIDFTKPWRAFIGRTMPMPCGHDHTTFLSPRCARSPRGDYRPHKKS